MSSDAQAPYLSGVRQWTHDLIEPLVPVDWRIIPHLSANIESLVTVVYITFRTIDNTEMPPGQAIAEMIIEVSPPKTDTDDAADDGVVSLVAALNHRKVQWTRAEKKRDPGGPITWEVTVRLIVTVQDPTQESGE